MFKKKNIFQESVEWYNGLEDCERYSVDDMLAKIDKHNNGLFYEADGLDYLLLESENFGRTMSRIYNDKRKGKKFKKEFSKLATSLYTYVPFKISLLIKQDPEKTLMKSDFYVNKIFIEDVIKQNGIVTLDISPITNFHSPNPILPEKKLYITPTWDRHENNVTLFISGTKEGLLNRENIYTYSLKEKSIMTYNSHRTPVAPVYMENETGSFISDILNNKPNLPPIYVLTRKRTDKAKQFFADLESKEELTNSTTKEKK